MIKNIIKKIPILNKIAGYIYEKYIYKGEPFPGSAQYWEHRYSTGGNSGDGSYNKLAKFKAEIINNFVEKNHIQTVIEYGSGDGNQCKLSKYPSYIGFDVSPTAVQISNKLFINDTTKEFRLLDGYSGETAELTLSLDVIYHLTEDDVFHSYMERLFNSSTNYVIIYSSDKEMKQNHHEKRRKFTKWVEINKQNWKLQKKIPNIYNNLEDRENFSYSDFYIYKNQK